MINRIIQTIIENKGFLEKSLENSINANEISMFSRDLRKVFDEARKKHLWEFWKQLILSFLKIRR